MAYSYDEDTKVHQLLFGCRWKAVKNDSEYSVATSQGRFTFNIQKACDVYAFVIRMDWTDVAKLSVFQSCTVSTEDGIQLSFSKFKFVLINNIHQHVTSIPCNQLSSENGNLYLWFRISSSDKADVPQPTLGDTILEKLYCDTTYSDVLFIFDSAMNSPSAKKAPKKKGRKKTAKPEKKEAVLSAHKLVLTQWPYFKAMFEGGFTESGPGEQQIKIQDTKMKIFELLLRFMYTGQLPEHLKSSIVYADEETEDSSMEDLFLAADRYDVQELREQALESLLDSLDAENAIPFLFRTAYKFPELRKPVVEFVAKSCGTAIPKKNIRNMYRDHPDVFDILVDLIDEYEQLVDRSEASK